MTENTLITATLLAERLRDKAQMVVNSVYDARYGLSSTVQDVAALRAGRLLEEVAYDAVTVRGLLGEVVDVKVEEYSEEIHEAVLISQ